MPSEFHKEFDRELESGLRGLEARTQRLLAKIRGVNFCTNDYPELSENAALREAVAGCGA